jgi:signal peptidase I
MDFSLKTLLIGNNLKVTLLRASVIALLVWLICSYLYLPFRAAGKSMEPTCKDGQWLFISARAYANNKPQRGDIIAIRMTGHKISLLKRIIGLPGERIAIKSGQLTINDKIYEEAYMPDKGTWNLNEQVLASDEYFVIGDNRLMPIKTHKFGKVKSHKIIGKWK